VGEGLSLHDGGGVGERERKIASCNRCLPPRGKKTQVSGVINDFHTVYTRSEKHNNHS